MQPDKGPSLNTFPQDWLSAYLDGELGEPERRIVEGALEKDSQLVGLLEELASTRSMVRTLSQHPSGQIGASQSKLLPWESPKNSPELPTAARLWTELDDGLEPFPSRSNMPVRLPGSKIRSRIRSLGVFAASFIGLIAMAATLWIMNSSDKTSQLSRLDSEASFPESGVSDVAGAGEIASMSAGKGNVIPMAPGSTDSINAMTDHLPGNEVADYELENLSLAFSSEELADSASVSDPLDWLIQMGIHRSVESELHVSTFLASNLSGDLASGLGGGLSMVPEADLEGQAILERQAKSNVMPPTAIASRSVAPEGGMPAHDNALEARPSTLPGRQLERSRISAEQLAAHSTLSAEAENQVAIGWYRAQNWSEQEVVEQQSTHPMLHTLQVFDQTSQAQLQINESVPLSRDSGIMHMDSLQNQRDSEQTSRDTLQWGNDPVRLGRQAAQRLDPSGLTPIAVIRITVEQSFTANQTIEKWQVSPAWTMPEESIRVLFVSDAQLQDLIGALGKAGDVQVSWLRPVRSSQAPDKRILVVHFLAR